ncbi:MAG: PstS family phosphate ABC transporter substrate-binding protein [Chloroflexota bacterium]|nr:PstS family phosphate ABC transporter substrate-binding protein [Chloroflexota bacterium]
MRKFLAICILLVLLVACRPAERETGANNASIQNVGSDTIVNLALAWAEMYQAQHPDARIAVTGGGSGTGIAGLVNGTVNIANASRSMKSEEMEAAQANGITPIEHIIARDAIAVVVHPSNPVDRLTLQQLSDIFSGHITNWSEVGGENRPIVSLSRESNSGTHVYFLEQVVRMGERNNSTLFSPDTLLMSSSEGISAEVRQNPNAIGYDGLGYVTSDQKTIAVAAGSEGPFVLPSIETVNSGVYPIARDLYMYTAGKPEGIIADYLAWILSPDGQAIVGELGFVPLSVSW